MSWLSTLEEYAAGYEGQLRAFRFYRIYSQDGPGMGACIEYANRNFDFCLTNDKGQFFLYFLNSGFLRRLSAGFFFRSRVKLPPKLIDFNFILAALDAARTGRDFAELSFEEKSALFNNGYSLEDPFADLFPNLEEIVQLLK